MALMKNVVHDYYENLNEECCSQILWKSYMKNVVHYYYENLNEGNIETVV